MWQRRFIKLLVVGDSGLGKTTLIRSLLAVPGEVPLDLHDGSETSFDDFQRDPGAFLSSVTWDDAEDRIRWVYQIQDTPGEGWGRTAGRPRAADCGAGVEGFG